MLSKLSLRNAKRSIRDYLVYLVTMTMIAAFMFAFNSMIFSESVKAMCKDVTVMACMIVIATIFIMFIAAWLIHYMVRFMLEKRSREFGTYLLLGMKEKQVAKLYTRENIIMGAISYIAGIVLGIFIQQIVMTLFYQVFSANYRLNIEISNGCMMMTTLCYAACFLIALLKNKRMFRKMSISDFMKMEKENEKIKEGGEKIKQGLFYAAIIFFIVFYFLLFYGKYSVNGVILCIIGFIASVYFFYIGLGAFLVNYIRKGKAGIYKKQNLFILRQMASKLKTMRFTMGTLTILLTVALLGGTVAMMFAKYENEAIRSSMPFDILIYSSDPADSFKEELTAIKADVGIRNGRLYQIYQDGSHAMNDYLYTHASNLGKDYQKADGSLDKEAIRTKDQVYYTYDTYMKLSDYNFLRKLLGYKEIQLKKDEYALQIKERMKSDLDKSILSRQLVCGEKKLSLSHAYTEAFSQNGNNGADYLLIVPDEICEEEMIPYYSDLVVSITSKPSDALQEKLENIRAEKNNLMTEAEYEKQVSKWEASEADVNDDAYEKREEALVYRGITMEGTGTDRIICIASDVLISDTMGKEILFVVTAIVFPLVYIGLVFLCVALTILAVQQLSDSAKYRFRYDVLRKLGMNEEEMDHVVFKQLLLYYGTPAIIAVILSGAIAIYAGNQFVRSTGAVGNGFSYFGVSLLLFLGVYFIYFCATYIGFKRNIKDIVR